MKKIASIVAAALVTCSLSACGNRNTAYRTPSTNQGGTNIGMNQGNYTAGVGNTVAYKDGVYLGEGNRTSMGNQAAIITVSGGRITDAFLKTLDAQGKEMYTGGTTNLERVRRDLSSAVISQQTHNVTVNNPGSDASSVNNWKLAVSRALESARK